MTEAAGFDPRGITLVQALKVVEAVRDAARSGIGDSPAGLNPSARDWARYVLEDAGDVSYYPVEPLSLCWPGASAPELDASLTLEMVIAELGDRLLLGVKVPRDGEFDDAKHGAAEHLFGLLLDIRQRMWQPRDQAESAPPTGP